MDWLSPLPLKVTVEVPGVKIPLFDQLPAREMLLLPALKVVLALLVRLPPRVMLPESVLVLLPERERWW